MLSSKTRLWQHEGLWRVQDYCQLTDRNGALSEAWESRRDEHGHVLFFETKEQAAAYMQNGKVERENKHDSIKR